MSDAVTRDVASQPAPSLHPEARAKHLPEGHQDGHQDMSQRLHRIIIGILGLFLPFLLPRVADWCPTDHLPSSVRLDSVSAYYYTGAVGLFVGVIFALSLFLMTYRGYKGVFVDEGVGVVAGLAALGVVFFPTDPPDPVPKLPWWTETTGNIHYGSAIVLFVCFFLFSFWLFRKSNVPSRRNRPTEKNVRNDICLVCSIAIVGGLIWAYRAHGHHHPIFVPESLMIEAFAISWLTKGEVHREVVAYAKRKV